MKHVERCVWTAILVATVGCASAGSDTGNGGSGGAGARGGDASGGTTGGTGGGMTGGGAGTGGASGTAGSGQAGGTTGAGGFGGSAGGAGAAGRGGGAGGRGGGGGAAGTGGAIGSGGKGGAAGQGGTAGGCPGQTAADPSTTSIAGTWDFTPAGGSKRSIQVPGGGWLKQGVNASSATYATQVTVPDSGGPQSTLIEFGAVNFQATLSVDGKEVGTNTTSFTPSIFDVTKFVTPGRQHAISVVVKGAQALKSNNKFVVPNAAGWSPNIAQGIFRSALLHVYPDVYVSDVFVRTSVTDDTLTYDVAITNTGTTSQDVTLWGALASWNCDPFAYPAIADKTITAAPGATTTVT